MNTPAPDVIPLFKVFMPDDVLSSVGPVLRSGWIGEGERVKAFERDLSAYIQHDHVLAVNSGTSALHLAARLLDLGPGDEVISTPMTCIATNTPFFATGARIVWGDVDPWTGNLDPADVARKITARTKAIVAVDWAGYPCDLNALGGVAAAHGLALVEDACLALGALYAGRPVGRHADFVCFSFQAIKHITTVDGGALACASPDACARGRRLRWYGLDRTRGAERHWDQDVEEWGYKFHMNDVAATLGVAQLKEAEALLDRRRANASAYDAAFQDCEGARPLRYAADRVSAYWVFPLRVRHRERFVQALRLAGIAASRVFRRNDAYQVFAGSQTPLPGVDEFDAEQVSIPCGWWLSDRDLARIISEVRRCASMDH